MRNQSSFATERPRVYRLSRMYLVYHYAVAIAALVGAVCAYQFWPLSVVAILFSALMIYRARTASVSVDQSSVTYKDILSTGSIQRSSITQVEILRGRYRPLVLWGNKDEKEGLTIPSDLFAFDDAWDEWLRTYRQIDDTQPLSLF